MKKSRLLGTLSAYVSMLLVSVASAAPITFNFTGTVFGTPNGVWSGATTVEGSYTYDSGFVDSAGFNFLESFEANNVSNLSFS